jgi:hypothetical protein
MDSLTKNYYNKQCEDAFLDQGAKTTRLLFRFKLAIFEGILILLQFDAGSFRFFG